MLINIEHPKKEVVPYNKMLKTTNKKSNLYKIKIPTRRRSNEK